MQIREGAFVSLFWMVMALAYLHDWGLLESYRRSFAFGRIMTEFCKTTKVGNTLIEIEYSLFLINLDLRDTW